MGWLFKVLGIPENISKTCFIMEIYKALKTIIY